VEYRARGLGGWVEYRARGLGGWVEYRARGLGGWVEYRARGRGGWLGGWNIGPGGSSGAPSLRGAVAVVGRLQASIVTLAFRAAMDSPGSEVREVEVLTKH
jgi:hypothetical protein